MVILTDTLPAGFNFIAASDGGTISHRTVTWTPFTLVAGASTSRSLIVEAVGPFTSTTITNTAAAYDLVVAGFDQNPADNSNSAATPLFPNQPPTPIDDWASTTSGTAVTLTLLHNDTDPDANPLQLISVSPSPSGTVIINPDNTLTYTPAPGHLGPDSRTYTVSDGQGGTATATVTIVTLADSIKINFQRPESDTPAGYLADGGHAFGPRGHGYTYGWVDPITGDPISNTLNARDRDWYQVPDQRYDTFNHMRRYGTYSWEMELPNGWYYIHAVVGDPEWVTATYGLDIEGILTIHGQPLTNQHWLAGSNVVQVTDGRLTLSHNTIAQRSKISFIEVTPLPSGPGPFSAYVNFQPATDPIPSGYIADIGNAYSLHSNGLTYGWDTNMTNAARNRPLPESVDQRYATLNHLQMAGFDYSWEMDVPNGTYAVFIMLGDPAYFGGDRLYTVNVEDQQLTSGNGTTTARIHGLAVSDTVVVSDGRFTLSNPTNATKNKIMFLHLIQIGN